jgi:hypothetical protein
MIFVWSFRKRTNRLLGLLTTLIQMIHIFWLKVFYNMATRRPEHENQLLAL